MKVIIPSTILLFGLTSVAFADEVSHFDDRVVKLSLRCELAQVAGDLYANVPPTEYGHLKGVQTLHREDYVSKEAGGSFKLLSALFGQATYSDESVDTRDVKLSPTFTLDPEEKKTCEIYRKDIVTLGIGDCLRDNADSLKEEGQIT